MPEIGVIYQSFLILNSRSWKRN